MAFASDTHFPQAVNGPYGAFGRIAATGGQVDDDADVVVVPCQLFCSCCYGVFGSQPAEDDGIGVLCIQPFNQAGTARFFLVVEAHAVAVVAVDFDRVVVVGGMGQAAEQEFAAAAVGAGAEVSAAV